METKQPKIEEENAKLKETIKYLCAESNIELPEDFGISLEVDWSSLVRPEGKIFIEGNEYVTLNELRRLARLRGYVSSKPRLVQSPTYENNRNASVEWEILWADGTVDGACADASWKTCNPGFRNFTVAIAANRAEARAIRAALGISTCSYEEIGPPDEDMSGPVSDQQVAAIKIILKRKKLDSDLNKLSSVVGDSIIKKINAEKMELSNLTHQEAIDFLGKLNAYKG